MPIEHKCEPSVGNAVSALSPNLSRRRQVRKSSACSRGGIVVSQNRTASVMGARVLKAGGHAVDAAVATAFALGVVEPWMSGIGGVGGMLVHQAAAEETVGFDFGPRAPMRLDPSDFVLTGERDHDNLFGWPMVESRVNTVGAKAVAAPTEPAGLAAAHKRFGRMRWRDLIAPAAKLAEDGLAIDWHTTLAVACAMADLVRNPGARARFLPSGHPPVPAHAVDPKPVQRLPMPDLGRILRAIAEEGADVLYTGPAARSIVEDIQAMGGYLGVEDLAAVRPREVEPLTIAYGKRSIHVLPELNGGPTMWVAFEDFKKRRTQPKGAPDAETFSSYAHALRAGWKDRFERMGDAGERTAPTSTTHISIVDRDGNIVTLTQTLLSLFGARIVLPGTGILMNNAINWFDPVPGGVNSIAPNRRGLANYAPAVMTGEGATIGIGGSGGRRIIPAVFQLLAMSADFGFNLEQALHQPRIDVSGADVVVADRRMPQEMIAALAAEFAIVLAEPVEYPFPYTIASAVRRVGEMNEGATEPQHPWSEAVSEDEV
jgi:gamma-glutamyltranspeptidase / glutathione hydrolase